MTTHDNDRLNLKSAGKYNILALEIVTCKLLLPEETYNFTFFSIQVCLRNIFLNHLAPPSMPKRPYFVFDLKFMLLV